MNAVCPVPVRSVRTCVLPVMCLLVLPLTGTASTLRVPQDYPTIQAAIDAAVPGDSVLLGPGVYQGPGNRDIGLRGKDLILTSSNGVDQTAIDCEGAGRGFYIHEGETRAARIEGITIRNGYALPGSPGFSRGAGVYCELSGPTFSHCKIINCWAGNDGGGMYLLCADPLVSECEFYLNASGGAWGGGILTECGSASFVDCAIVGNFALQQGGGVALGPTIGPGVTFSGCTIAANSCNDEGGGIFDYGIGNVLSLERSIVWGNSAQYGPEISCSLGDIRCSDVDTTGVTGNASYDADCLCADPMFCSPYDWTLNGCSPCLPEYSPCGELIGAAGQGCGPSCGACCLLGGLCLIASEAQCSAYQGVYQGDGIGCDPNPCQPVQVQQSTWGRIKAGYGGRR